jgi:hypothetical protein
MTRRYITLAIAISVVLAAIASLRPSDTSWLLDEPQLLREAFLSNQRGQLAVHGLRGSMGFDYGPVPVQLYQLLLLLTSNDLPTVAAMKGFLATFMFSLGTLFLMRTLGATTGVGIAWVISPLVWQMNRDLWDNVLLLPLSVWAIVLYTSLRQACNDQQRETRGCLVEWTQLAMWVVNVLMVLVHLMALPLVAAIAVCETLRAWRSTIIAATLACVLTLPLWMGYARHILAGSPAVMGMTQGFEVVSPRPWWPERDPIEPLPTGLMPLAGLHPVTFDLPVWACLAMYGLVAYLLYILVRRPDRLSTVQAEVARLVLIQVAVSLIVFHVALRESLVHYHFGTVAGAWCLFAMGHAHVRHKAIRVLIAGCLVIGLGWKTLNEQALIAQSQATSTPGFVVGPTLGRAIAIAEAIQLHQPQHVVTFEQTQGLLPDLILVPLIVRGVELDSTRLSGQITPFPRSEKIVPRPAPKDANLGRLSGTVPTEGYRVDLKALLQSLDHRPD